VSPLILSLLLFASVLCIVAFGAFRARPTSSWQAVGYLFGALLFFGGVLNFILFWHAAVYLGGDAINGKIENGKHFVASHGRLTEVSPAVWEYSRFHAKSIWITHPLAGLGALLMYLTGSRQKELVNQAR
jgi:hypothetical protein